MGNVMIEFYLFAFVGKKVRFIVTICKSCLKTGKIPFELLLFFSMSNPNQDCPVPS